VPARRMLFLHKASLPTSVLDRARLSRPCWRRWKKQSGSAWPELRTWLYAPKPYRSSHKSPPDGIQPTKAMRAFQRHASINAVLKAARKLEEEGSPPVGLRPGPARNVTDSGGLLDPKQVFDWLDQYERHTWFRTWLLQGEALPSEVTLVTLRQSN